MKGQTVCKDGPRPHFGNQNVAQSHALVPQTPPPAIYPYSEEKDHIKQTIKTIDIKIRDERKVHALRKLCKGKSYLCDLSEQIESGNTYLSPWIEKTLENRSVFAKPVGKI
jgi:hypothetical protein